MEHYDDDFQQPDWDDPQDHYDDPVGDATTDYSVDGVEEHSAGFFDVDAIQAAQNAAIDPNAPAASSQALPPGAALGNVPAEFGGTTDLNSQALAFAGQTANTIMAHPYEPWTWPSMQGGTGILLGETVGVAAGAEQTATAIAGAPAWHAAFAGAAAGDPWGVKAGLESPLDHMLQDQQLESQSQASLQQWLDEQQGVANAQGVITGADQATWNAWWATLGL